MADVVNTVPDNSGNSMWGLVGLLLVILVALVVIFYGLPLLRNSQSAVTTPQINVPGQIDVNLNQNPQ